MSWKTSIFTSWYFYTFREWEKKGSPDKRWESILVMIFFITLAWIYVCMCVGGMGNACACLHMQKLFTTYNAVWLRCTEIKKMTVDVDDDDDDDAVVVVVVLGEGNSRQRQTKKSFKQVINSRNLNPLQREKKKN